MPEKGVVRTRNHSDLITSASKYCDFRRKKSDLHIEYLTVQEKFPGYGNSP